MIKIKAAVISSLALATGAFAVAMPLQAQESRTGGSGAKMDHGAMQMGQSMSPADMAKMKDSMARMDKMMAHCEEMMKKKTSDKAQGSSQGQGTPKR